VISGGQTGVDQAALRAAQTCGLPCGGWRPPDRLCEAGEHAFPLEETPADRSPHAPDVPRSLRTEWNVRDSDGTLILRPAHGLPPGPGTAWTEQCAAQLGKPLLICEPTDPQAGEHVRRWLSDHRIETLNVAGPSEETAPGISDLACEFLVEIFRACRAPGSPRE